MRALVVQKDIRQSQLFRDVESLYERLRRPGSGLIVDAAELSVSPDGLRAAFAGTFTDSLDASPHTRICETQLGTGDTRVLTFGPRSDRSPKYSPDGRWLAFLSDRHAAGDFQLHLWDAVTHAVRPAPRVQGWVEYLHWSADGGRILLGVAGHGADLASAQGATSSGTLSSAAPSWMPVVDIGDESCRWRSAWSYELTTGVLHQISPAGLNVWEAVWCGDERIAAVVSTRPEEGHWYSARLHILNVATGVSRELFAPRDQIGCLAAVASGRRLAFVEALCSDRGVIAGLLRLIDTDTGHVETLDTNDVDVTCTEWRSEDELLIAGHRGLQTVVARCDVSSRTVTEEWSSHEKTSGSVQATVAGCAQSDACVLIGEGFFHAPEIALIRAGQYKVVKSFESGCGEEVRELGAVERLSWIAPDGLDIQGWLLRPKRPSSHSHPHPLVMTLHGGPVSQWRPRWLGRSGIHNLMLLAKGYAVFLPNPRGSSGRGPSFARRVLGDIGGADADDCLSGLDSLVALGRADPHRLGVTGGSYGGFMTCWLITQDTRFAAAVPLAPHTNHVTQHLLSNIPHFMPLFLGDSYGEPTGKYFQRNPVMHAYKARTPTLLFCGALDRCTPPEEATQFHRALLEHGVRSVLVCYPAEGHGIRKLPAAIDYVARLVAWFEEHMPADEDVNK